MLHKKQLGRGCFDTTTQKYKILNLEFKTCPGNYSNNYIYYLWQLFTHYENNLLPYKGSLGEQPAKIIEIFDIIQEVVRDYEEKLKKVKRLKDKQLKG